MSPQLQRCTLESMARAALDAYTAGLMPDGREGYLIPRWNSKLKANEANFQASFHGKRSIICEEMAIRAITSQVVREGEPFKWEEGLEPVLEHTPDHHAKGEIVAAYAIAWPTDQTLPPLHFVADRQRLQDARAQGGDGWKTHPAQMAEKTAIHRLADAVGHTPSVRERLAAATRADRAYAAAQSESAPSTLSAALDAAQGAE